MSSRDSFVFRKSFYDAAKVLSSSDQLKIYEAIIKYALFETEPELEGVLVGYFTLIKTQIDTDINNYNNGKKGGRPKKNKEIESGSSYKKFKDFPYINITEDEFIKLCTKYTEPVVMRIVELLDGWFARGSKAAKQYIGKNHYAHFRQDNWAVQKALTELEDKQNSKPNWSV